MVTDAEVFISYASRDVDRVVAITQCLEAQGVRIWRDQERILGGECYGPAIVQGIKHSKVLLLLCSAASLASRNVKQEILLAWKYAVPYLPLLLEPVNYPEQLEYWLEGWQWLEVLDRTPARWLPAVLRALTAAGVTCQEKVPGSRGGGLGPVTQPLSQAPGLAGLWKLARYTDRIWPIPATRNRSGVRAGRDLGAPQEDAQHRFRLGDWVRLVLELDRPGHLLLLDQGTSGRLYCLCPSAFAPDTWLPAGPSELPQADSRYEAFTVTGQPGREELLAIVTDEPLELGWSTAEPRQPARVLNPADSEALLARLVALEEDRWLALATYFEVIP